MRAVAIFLFAFAGLLVAPAALAAPILLDAAGGGDFELTTDMRNALLGMCILGGFICLVLLLPDFDGREDSDWDGNYVEGRRPY